MCLLATSTQRKSEPPKLTHSVEYGCASRKMQTAHCTASGTVCECKVFAVSSSDVSTH